MNTNNMENKKVWFITGASKGLGLALAKQLLQIGHQVVATSRNSTSLINAINFKGEAFLPLQVDLSSDQDVAAAIRQAHQTFGQIDVVVNNAGYGIGGSIEELTDKETRDSFDINVFGTINVIRHALPILRAQASGHIINISSIAGIAPAIGWSVYGAAKHAIIGLSEVLADEVKELGIKVTVIAPGAFRTNFLQTDSLVLSERKIDAYANIRASHERYTQMNGHQAGDPEKAAKAMIELAEMPEPPVYLLLGSDAYARAFSKLELLASSYKQWEALTKSTDY
ncbi:MULTISPECIES: oxidoreductase [Olivibacter]|jgi:NAD(P)-dependent dehydrogenase (short-subunit alcohol dehydrogenase family)|uniref:Oxidoreductase n=2 Tax=Olivibacter TaxID=376469 RepID=A0ABV6HNY3_9SPHI|nr:MULTISPECIES: oxidoreductase [Olivibacter]MCL4637640.1 oxidoreductase [Olivibacter sp. UJ_SKK_5.1]MDM8173608.1 oxidoreductase [Olivibacter sp. 47]MDX3914698.1 oxidoreductase [Pseudosphingobacterium sp.]QEL03322.1 SDR family NAD(P)-dependent oxidoreductase [Olivibacter sp. LS-1]